MWDLALMIIFINHPLYMGYSSSQYETRCYKYYGGRPPNYKLLSTRSGHNQPQSFWSGLLATY
jgi:hypothetical protein